MISTALTLSLERTQAHFEAGPRLFQGQRRAWIGFESSSADASPLHAHYDGASLVLRCVDWDVDDRHAHWGSALQCHSPPTAEIAAQIVRFVRELHTAEAVYVLCVHCGAGRYRSGAVVEWCARRLGVPEHPLSTRHTPDENGITAHTANRTLLRLLLAAG